MEDTTVQPVSKSDLEGVLQIMNQYNRNNGFMAFVDNKLKFFDSKPSFPACFVTKQDVEQYIKSY